MDEFIYMCVYTLSITGFIYGINESLPIFDNEKWFYGETDEILIYQGRYMHKWCPDH